MQKNAVQSLNEQRQVGYSPRSNDMSFVRMTSLLGPIAAVTAVGKLGEALAPALLARGWPLTLVALNANDMNLVLSVRLCTDSARLAAWFCVSTARRVAEDAFFFWIGHRHHGLATELLGLKLDSARWWLASASLCALVVVPGAPVCLVAALADVRWMHFLVADATATAARAVLLWWTSGALAPLLDMLLAWVTQHWRTTLLITAGAACIGAAPLVRRLRTFRTSSADSWE